MLVAYGSDAESDDEQPQQPQSKPVAASQPNPATSSASSSALPAKPSHNDLGSPGTSAAGGGGLQLPPPKGKKANRGPVKISLTDVTSADAPAPETSEPAKKRPKLGAFGSGGGGGLSSLLPAPKKETVKPASGFGGQPVVPERAEGSALKVDGQAHDGDGAMEQEEGQEQSATASLMMPKSVKKKQPAAASASAQAPAPVEDMFGLGSVSASSSTSSAAPSTSAPIPASSSSSQPTKRKAFTAAPTVAEKPKQNYYATLPSASPNNPYPGFHCIPQTGQWEPDRPDEWAEWAVMHGWAPSAAAAQEAEASSSAAAAPKGFEGAELGDVSEVSSEQQRAEAEASRQAAKDMPSKAAYVDPKEEEEKKLKLARLQQGAGRARGKNQLSSLLSNAIGQREDLEERIALAKSNKRAGGKKYGF